MLEKFISGLLSTILLSLGIGLWTGTPSERSAYGQGLASTLNLSPFWNWKVIETEHFRVTFPIELTETAQIAANDLEEAHGVLSKRLYWESARKVPVLLMDHVDSANGLTTPLEDFGIALYATPPDNWFSTAYYDDWLRLLCFHEYTHFLNMDAARGAWTVGRYLFGDVLLPSAAWPPWMLEGLAVYMETRYTHGGRGRSPFYEMILRTAVEDGTLNTGKNFTLDRINSESVPYYPGGEAVYLYGYKLMEEVAKDNQAGPTADGAGNLKSGEDALGILSYRSSWRIPYFINGNLENITGRDWYSYWDQFVSETRRRALKELGRVHSQPVTTIHPLKQGAYQVAGSAFSPDGHWLAYTAETYDEKNSLYLRDLKSGEDHLIVEKIAGVALAFTPDSKFVIFSSLRQEAEYYEYSELGVYGIETGQLRWMTHRLRARDPDVSPDGKQVVFAVTQSHGSRTGIAVAELVPLGESFTVKHLRWVFTGDQFDACAQPKFSSDGKTVYFSLHRNGQASEELMASDLSTRHARILVSNGKFNRYAAVSRAGDLYFVSDLSGIDNLYRYHEGAPPEMVSNLTTGLSFPSVAPDGKIYGAVFSSSGWDLAALDPLPSPVSPDTVTIEPAPIPPLDADSNPKHLGKKYKIDDYSLLPSLWPRAWIPYVGFSPGNFSFGETVTGYDAVDRHRYTVDLGYDTLSSSADWYAQYENRSLGPTLAFSAQDQLSSTSYFNGSLYNYTRDAVFSFAVYYPFLWTFSSLTPEISFSLDQTSYRYPGMDTANSSFDYKTSFLPTLDFILAHSSAERSRLAITSEEGRNLEIGTRYYVNNGDGTQVAKALLSDFEYLRIGPQSHIVLVPSIQASFTTANPMTNNNLNSDVVVRGHLPALIDSFVSSSLSQLPIRGYPNMTYYVKAAAVTALDLRFPLARVFRGWGTNPFFLDQVWGFVFGEAAIFPYGPAYDLNTPKVLSSSGGGLVANLEAFIDVPITFTTEYHYGFQTSVGGAGELFSTLAYTGFSF